MAEEKKGSMVRLLVIIMVVLVVDVAAGLFIGVKFVIPMLYPTEEAVREPEDASDTPDGEAGPVHIQQALDPININPRNSSGDIFSIEIVLETDNQAVIDELALRNYEIRDKLSSYLTFKSIAELNDQANWEIYKKEMMQIVNDSVLAGDITALFIPSKIIQFM